MAAVFQTGDSNENRCIRPGITLRAAGPKISSKSSASHCMARRVRSLGRCCFTG